MKVHVFTPFVYDLSCPFSYVRVHVTPSATSHVRSQFVYVVDVTFWNHAAPSSHPTASFLHGVTDVTTHPEETMTPSFVYCPFHADVEVCIAPAELIMTYVVAVAPTVTVPPAYCPSTTPTRYVPAPIRTTRAPSVESLYKEDDPLPL